MMVKEPDVEKRIEKAKEKMVEKAVKQEVEKPSPFKNVIRSLERKFPTLSKKLKMADMEMTATQYITRAITLTISASLILQLALVMLLSSLEIDIIYGLLFFPIILVGMFLWVMHYPDLKIRQKERELNKDVLYAGRDILIALRAGVPLFNAMANVTRNYGVASREFAKIITRIDSGVPAEVALQEASEMNTSEPFKRILLQMSTSLRSGSDVAAGLETVLNQLSTEQVIILKRYGQKLNPITMFYMLFGIILPSLGIAVGIILTSFVAIRIDFGMLMVIALLIVTIQYIFLAIIMSSRPDFEV